MMNPIKALGWAIGFHKEMGYWLIPLSFAYVGHLIDKNEKERSTMYRDKSKLFGRELKAGEAPSW